MDDTPGRSLSIESDRVGIRDLAYRSLREAIVSGRLRPGMPVPEGQLAVELNVSRTPLREAFVRLQSESLLTRARNGRLFVTDVSAQEAIHLYSVRIALEELAITDAIEHGGPGFVDALEASISSWRLDDPSPGTSPGSHFHGLIHAASSNPINRRLIDQLHVMSDRYGVISVRNHQSRRERAHVEHEKIVTAVRSRDAAGGRRAIRSHLANACASVVSALGGEDEFRHELERLHTPR